MYVADANLSHLEPSFRPRAEQWLEECCVYFKTRITVTHRGERDQDACEASGLSKAKFGSSPHNCVDDEGYPASRAFDFAIFNPDGSYVSDGSDSRYAKAGQIAEDLGLSWGGSWHHPDFDHIELPQWRSNPTEIDPNG